MSKKTGLILLIIASLGLLVLFLFMPQQPASVREKAEKPMDADSLKLMKAIELVNGPNPMEGITILREIVSKDDANIDAHYWLGVFSVKSGQYDKAIERFNKVIDINPEYLAAYIDMGGLYMELDSAEKALTYFKEGVAIDSTNNYALLFAAQTEEKLERYEEAKKSYEQLLRHNTDTIVVNRVKEFINNIETKLNR
ncbi:MAG: tetratricopeptide repeat protein [Flavobacteriales bacterium]|jgi:tetratricopeptide (TPR) repeat protein